MPQRQQGLPEQPTYLSFFLKTDERPQAKEPRYRPRPHYSASTAFTITSNTVTSTRSNSCSSKQATAPRTPNGMTHSPLAVSSEWFRTGSDVPIHEQRPSAWSMMLLEMPHMAAERMPTEPSAPPSSSLLQEGHAGAGVVDVNPHPFGRDLGMGLKFGGKGVVVCGAKKPVAANVACYVVKRTAWATGDGRRATLGSEWSAVGDRKKVEG